MITKFRLFESEADGKFEYQGRYLNLQKLDTGNLKIILTPDGVEEAKEGVDGDNFTDFFDDIRGNSEYEYFPDMSYTGLGMSEAPCITDGYYYDDDGKLTDADNEENSEIFWYPNYMIKNFTEELVEDGFVIFVTNSPRTAEEVEKIRFERKVKKYNI